MSDKYDEDLFENPFFVALQHQFVHLLNKAAANGWLVCIPQFSCVLKKPVSPGEVEDHILVPVGGAESEGGAAQSYQSLSSKDSEIVRGKLVTKRGYDIQQEVTILFEETFHTDNDESYRVVCVDRYLNSKTETPVDERSIIKRPTTYEQCIDLLWNHTGGLKSRDHLDKLLTTLSLAFDQLEGAGLRQIVDVASTQFTKVMQHVLKVAVLKRTARHSTTYMENLKIAVETYYMHAVFRKLFRVVTASVGSKDAEVNKLTRNLSALHLEDLGIKKSFSKNVSLSKIELSRLNNFTTPIGRLFCIKRVVATLTRPPRGSNASAPEDMMTTDDFLPILIYLIVKSEIPNWMANLAFMTNFHFSKCSEDAEFGFYLASIEAALEHITTGKVHQEVLSKDKIKGYGWQGINGATDENTAMHSSGTNLVVDEFFQKVQNGDEDSVRAMLEKPKKVSEELLEKLCHPLCYCDKCGQIQAQIQSDSSLVTAYTRDTRGYTALHISACYGQAQLIDLLVQHGAVVDATDYLGLTPLHLACQHGFQNVMLLLLHFGSCIMAVDTDGNTPLHLGSANGHEDCVKALIFFDSTGKKIDINVRNDIGDTPLHLASKWGYESIVKTLIESDADPSIRNRKKQTPLSLTQNVTVQCVLTLAVRGIDIQPVTIQENMKENVNIITSPTGSNRHITSPTGPNRPITPTAGPSRSKKIPRSTSAPTNLKENFTFKFETAALDVGLSEKLKKKIENLFRAIQRGDIQLVKFYLGFDKQTDDFDDSPDGVEGEGHSGEPCHPLCQCHKCHNLFKRTAPRSPEDLSINCQSTNGYSPLHMAILHRQPDLVTTFLQHGAAVNMQNHRLMTPVHLAVFVNDADMLKALLEHGGKVKVQDVNGDTPLHIASATGFTAGVTMLLQHNAGVSVANNKGNTPLHEASERNHTPVVHALLQHGADTHCKNMHGLKPVDLAQGTMLKNLLEKHASNSEKTNAGSFMKSKLKSDNQMKPMAIRDLFAAFEEPDLDHLHSLMSSIRTFSRTDSLRRISTHDLSAPRFDATLAKNLSIKSFNHGQLRHIDSQDKSEPLYIYKLAMQGQKGALEEESMHRRSSEEKTLDQRSSEEESMHQKSSEDKPLHQRSSEEESMHQRSSEEKTLDQRSSGEEPLHQRSSEEKPLHQRSSEEKPLHQRSGEEPLHQRSSEEESMHQRSGEEPLHHRSSEEESMHQKSSGEEPLHQRSSEEESMHQKSSEDKPLHQRSSEEESMHQKSSEDKPLHQRSSKDKPLHQRSSEDKPLHQRSSKEDPQRLRSSSTEGENIQRSLEEIPHVGSSLKEPQDHQNLLEEPQVQKSLEEEPQSSSEELPPLCVNAMDSNSVDDLLRKSNDAENINNPLPLEEEPNTRRSSYEVLQSQISSEVGHPACVNNTMDSDSDDDLFRKANVAKITNNPTAESKAPDS